MSTSTWLQQILLEMKKGGISITDGSLPGYSVVHKFGRNDAVGSSFAPVAMGAVYQTPQLASATTLRVAAGGNANDTAAGTGAREVTLIGLDETGADVEEAVATAGASASAVTTATFSRLFRAFVSASGTYATTAAGSHAADIVIENGAGGTTWATIDATGYPRGQTEIAAYTVPLGFTAYVPYQRVTADGNKAVDIVFFQRRGIDDAAAPYDAMRTVNTFSQVLGNAEDSPEIPRGPFPALTDIGFMAKAATAATVECEFTVILDAT